MVYFVLVASFDSGLVNNSSGDRLRGGQDFQDNTGKKHVDPGKPC
jgi:hypothetical protein